MCDQSACVRAVCVSPAWGRSSAVLCVLGGFAVCATGSRFMVQLVWAFAVVSVNSVLKAAELIAEKKRERQIIPQSC